MKIQLLGGFQISDEQGPLAGFTNTRLQSVLAHLILNRSAPQARQQLAYLFWPESTDSQARTNLRNILHLLRTQLPDVGAHLTIDAQSVQWRADSPATVDVIEFEQAADLATRAQAAEVQQRALAQAIACYTGDLLPSCYEEWILPLRETWQQRYLSTMEQLIDLLEQQRNYRGALEHAQRLLQYDPLLESTYGRIMQLHAAQGDRAAALRVYHLCRTTLTREVGVDPSPTTQAIYEQLLNLETAAPASEPLRMSTPLVGRDDAWNRLQQQWQQVVQQGRKDPTPHFVMIDGEAGIGKTRLVEELVTAVRRQGNATAVAHCYPAGGRLAYAPLQGWLRTPDIERHRHKLSPLLQQGVARLLPELAIEVAAAGEPSPMTDAAHRRRLFEAVLAALAVAGAPLLLVLDDIQWCDRDTLEWLEFLLYSNVSVPLLVVATLRSEEFAATDALAHLCTTLERTGHLSTLPLARLTAAETAELVASLTGQANPRAAQSQIFQETDGIPLFIVETVRATLQNQETTADAVGPGAEDPPRANPLPPKIQAVVESRLVRLSPDARALANLAAVVGRAFSTELLAGASTLGEDELVQGLDELWQQQLIQEQTTSHDESYIFAHDKLREVVYGLLSPMRRRLLHRRVAEALDQLATKTAQDASAQIALHYELAGQPLVAIEWLLRAAQVAHRLSALQDALTHLDQARQLLQALHGEVDEGALGALELPLQMQRGALLLVTKGYAAPEVEQALTRALHLCASGGTPAQRFGVLWGLGRYYLVKPDLDKGLEVSQRLLQLAEASRSSDLLVEAYTTVGTYRLHRAELHEALRYFEQALALYDQDLHGNHTVTYGQDPGVVSLSYSAWAHWCLGETDAAKAQTFQALALAEELGYPYNQAIAQTYAAAQFQYMGDVEQCLHSARAASTLATEHGFILWQAMADFLQGWSHAQQGDLPTGMDLMQRSAHLFQSTGAELGACYFAALLAEVLGEQGQIEPATVAIQNAFDLLERTQDRWCAAEIHRVHGQLLLLQTPGDGEGKAANASATHEAATAAFERGLQIAQEQSAEWWAARCRESLAQLAA